MLKFLPMIYADTWPASQTLIITQTHIFHANQIHNGKLPTYQDIHKARSTKSMNGTTLISMLVRISSGQFIFSGYH